MKCLGSHHEMYRLGFFTSLPTGQHLLPHGRLDPESTDVRDVATHPTLTNLSKTTDLISIHGSNVASMLNCRLADNTQPDTGFDFTPVKNLKKKKKKVDSKVGPL